MSEEMQAVRTLDVVEMEIRVLQDQTQRVVLGYAIETGKRLEEAKEMLAHGEWGGWLKKMGYSQSTANNLMRVFREYGASQQSLFGGEANSQALGNLSYTKALQLLALPDTEEREKFVAEHDVEHMSTRELEKALKERDEALRKAEKANAEAKAAEEARSKMETDMHFIQASVKKTDEVERELAATKSVLQGEQKESAELRADNKKLRDELKELKDRPVEVAVETREPTEEELEKLTLEAVEKARAEYRERLKSLEKQLAFADGDMAVLKLLFEAWQEDYNKMMGYLDRIELRDAEMARKMRNGVEDVVRGWARNEKADNR